MGRRFIPFTEAGLKRLIKALETAGISKERIIGVKLTEEAAILLLGDAKHHGKVIENEWDEVLKNDEPPSQ